jgi:hypothetical protein
LESETLTDKELAEAYKKVSDLYQQLMDHWREIVDIPRREEIG